MYAFASANLAGVLFQENRSTTGRGGGLYAGGSADLSRVRFIRNSAVSGGGLAQGLGVGEITNSLFAENTASNSVGMAMLLDSVGPVAVTHATIVGPIPAVGSAVAISAGSVEITNTILTNHEVGISRTGGDVMQDFNLFFANGSDVQGTIVGGVNNVPGNPQFVDPAGGDYHISNNSPAVDAGSDTAVSRDYDGQFRPWGLGFDIGYDEVNPASQMVYLPLTIR
jgi:predicted outer membrane repeat protein